MIPRDPTKCGICGALLNATPQTLDCGGDCARCMAECGDPGAIRYLKEVEKAERKPK